MESRRLPPTPARLDRLADELAEEGFEFVLDDHRRHEVLEELDYAVRPPVHERRVPSYGAIVIPTTEPESWTTTTELVVERLPTTEYGDAEIRRFADGNSSWAIRSKSGLDELIVFDRSAGSERDTVILASAAGGLVVQRDPNGVVRVVGPWGVVRRDLTGWHHEPPLEGWLADIPGCQEAGHLTTLGRVLTFAVHDLGSRNIGSLLVFHPTGELGVAHERRLPTPPALRIDRPHDLAPLRHAMAHSDGATVFDHSGTLRLMGVRLLPSVEAERDVRPIGGTRHTSARRYSYDEPTAIVIAVSEDGPVTVFRAGDLLGRSVPD